MPTPPFRQTTISKSTDNPVEDNALIPRGADDFETAEILHLVQSSSAIYSKLAEHQQSESWSWQKLIAVLRAYAEIFNVEFKLDIPEITLCIDRLDCKRYGHFRYGHNGFGLRGEIALNSRYLEGNRPFWHVLGTLQHELLHAWQQAHGTPAKGNHHNVEFCNKALGLGLIVDKRGVTTYSARSPFKDLLASLGVDTSDINKAASVQPVKGNSKLHRWNCGCTNVRVAIADFQAKCLKCGGQFKQ